MKLLFNRSFPSCLKPLFQGEAKCSAFDMKMIFHFHANKAHFHKKGSALGLFFESEGFWNSEVVYFQRDHGGGGLSSVGKGQIEDMQRTIIFYVIRLDHLPVAWVTGTCFKTIQSTHVTKTTCEFGQK